jgi:transposase
MERKQRTIYSTEFKIKAVELSNQRGSLTLVASELNISKDNLKRWKREHQTGIISKEGKRQLTGEELELIRLKKELIEVKLERDILKKAVGIFSKSDK